MQWQKQLPLGNNTKVLSKVIFPTRLQSPLLIFTPSSIRNETIANITYTSKPADGALTLASATMPCSKAEGLVLTVDPNVIHKVDTHNAQNLFNMWTGK